MEFLRTAQKLCAQQTASLLSEKPGGFFDSITQGDTETGIALGQSLTD
ncbi:MAG: hypothetical protein KH544_03640 [Firmicutes bacterium]|nr:hypothetical protein [Bacillota bacterium]